MNTPLLESRKCPRNAVETCTLVYSVLNCIVTSFATFLIGMGFAAFCLSNFGSYRNSNPSLAAEDSAIAAAIWMCLCVAVVVTGFSIVLANGLMKRNATNVKIYFCFTVTVVFLLFSSAVALSLLHAEPYQEYVDLAMTVLIAASFLQSLCLVMIRHTYKQFESEAAAAAQKSNYIFNITDFIQTKHKE